MRDGPVMEQSLFSVWLCLLGAGLALVQSPTFAVTSFKAHPQPPRLNYCVFKIRSNITCHWEPGDIPAMLYTLEVQRMSLRRKNESLVANNSSTFSCITTGTSCTIEITNLKVRIVFCIRIIAHSEHFNLSSKPRCQPGRKEVILPPVNLTKVEQVLGSPKCLNVTWHRSLSGFPVSDQEIKNRSLISQIEFHSETEPAVRVHDVTVTGFSVLVCLFKPYTLYTIRLRNRYQSSASPWSAWSNSHKGRTSEGAPSAAPTFWRQVKHTDVNGRRLVSLLWKPIPSFLANGRVLFYNVTCQTEDAGSLSDYGNCRDLHDQSTSCTIPLPASHCSCALTASTSAGTSPEARIWFCDGPETELLSRSKITLTALDDNSLQVSWTAPEGEAVSGFVVEWFVVRETTSSILYWEKLNSSCTTLVMKEGVYPMECYTVSVKMLYGEHRVGKIGTRHNYTREGTPSAGPNVTVQSIFGNKVELSWSPLPVEQLHGFLLSYTLFYATRNEKSKSVIVPGNVRHYTLENLFPGNYDIFMQANTAIGTGPSGTPANVHIGSEEISIVSSVVVPLMMSFLLLMACVVQITMIKQKLWHKVPDPSKSTLSQWIPETIVKSKFPPMVQEKHDIKYSEVILLDELQDLEEDHGYRSLQTNSVQQFSSLRGRTSGTKVTSVTKAKETSVTDPSTTPTIYSDILLPQTLKNLPTHPLFSSTDQTNDCESSIICFNAVTLQPNTGSKSPDLHPSDEEKSCFLVEHLQILTSFPDLDTSTSSSVLFSHQNEFSRFNSVLSRQTNPMCQSQASFDSFMKSFSIYPHSVFVDYNYYSVECDPYIPPAV